MTSEQICQTKQNKKRPQLTENTHGLTTVEYVILLVLVAALCVATWNQLGQELKSKLGGAGDEIATQLGSNNGSAMEGTVRSGADPGSGSDPAAPLVKRKIVP